MLVRAAFALMCVVSLAVCSTAEKPRNERQASRLISDIQREVPTAEHRDATLAAVEKELARKTYCLVPGQSPLMVLDAARNVLKDRGYRAAEPQIPRIKGRIDYEALYDWFVADGKPLFQVLNLGDNSRVIVLVFSRRGAEPSLAEVRALEVIDEKLEQLGIAKCTAGRG